ncbi:hypothetical protein [Pseudomonas aeruginosa]|uniref:hypothetical protein n=1 Tax=Pseudomonas aeruginosa TaxID=287 RepID=UPI002735C305|nr:hypothetical protein [Pseudomonas aeruginosa]MDP2556109.1 hypothetical protein [Pseudomonas aeruginosa]
MNEVQKLLERIQDEALDDPQEPAEDMTIERPEPTEDLLRFRDLVIEQALIKAVSGTFFDICPIDRIVEAINARLGRCDAKTPVQVAMEPALRALHCIHFDSMTESVRTKLPDVLLAYFGLDDATGADMLGPEAWTRVSVAYNALATPAPEAAPEAAPPVPMPAMRSRSWFRRLVEWLSGSERS